MPERDTRERRPMPTPPNGYRSERETREQLTDMWRKSGMDRATADRLAEQAVRNVSERIEKGS